jgi:hypothetical protein
LQEPSYYEPEDIRQEKWQKVVSFMRNNPKLLMQMIPGGDIIDDDRTHVDRVLPTRNRLYSKVKGKQNF